MGTRASDYAAVPQCFLPSSWKTTKAREVVHRASLEDNRERIELLEDC